MFLQQKLDVMDEVRALQICKSSFSEADIAAARKLQYAALNKSDQMMSHRREGTPKSLQDIITVLKETDPDDVPTFVAKELHKLPPVTVTMSTSPASSASSETACCWTQRS